MKLPWAKRAEEMHKDTVKAEENLLAVKQRWALVKGLTEVSKVKVNGNEITSTH